MPATRAVGEVFPLEQSRGKNFYRQGGGVYMLKQSALTVILKLVIGRLISVILIVVSTINLQFQGWFVSISVRPVLSIESAYVMGLPRWLSGKESTCQCRKPKKIPWRRKWQPTPVALPGKFHGQRNLVGPSPWIAKESDTS